MKKRLFHIGLLTILSVSLIGSFFYENGFISIVEASPGTDTWQVGASSDDCHRRLTPSAFSLILSEYYAGSYDAANYKYGTGMRFTSITVPQNYTIDSAYLKICAAASLSGTTVNTRISAEDVDDAPTFADNATEFDNRWASRTGNRIDWDNIAAWTADVWYTSPDIKAVIQEIVDRVGWSSGNDIVLFWEDFDNRSSVGAHRRGHSWDRALGPELAGKLEITWSISDTEAPTYSNVGKNSTEAGKPALFYTKWTDNVAMSGYIFGTDNTGTWVNDTFVELWGDKEEIVIAEHNATYPRLSGFFMARMPNGSLYGSWRSISGTITTWGSYSNDNGATWLPKKEVELHGEYLVSGNKVFCFYIKVSGSFPTGNCSVHYKISTDNGETWGSEQDMPFPHNWMPSIMSPIKTQNGTLMVGTSWWWKTEGAYEVWNASVFRSFDDGSTWSLGGNIYASESLMGCDEPAIVELSNNSIYMLLRVIGDGAANKRHFKTISNDYGTTWSTPEKVESLYSTDTMAYMIRYSSSPNTVVLVWVNRTSPDSSVGRRPLLASVSYDDCETWQNVKTLDPSPNPKSVHDFDMVITPDEHIIVSCRRYNDSAPYSDDAVTQRFTIGWFSQASGWSNVTKILDSTVGRTVQWQIWANDTSNNWNTTGLQSLVLSGLAYRFYGVYDEDTGLLLPEEDRAVNVTAYFTDGTSPETFEVNGTYAYDPVTTPEYFRYNLTYAREYWLSEGGTELQGTPIYIFSAPSSTTYDYTISFLDYAGVLDSYPFVEAQRYINGTLKIVEKRKVDIEKKVLMALVYDVKYRITVRNGYSYTFGDLLMTIDSTVTLPLKVLDFPDEILLGYQYLRVWIYRESATSIGVNYQDLLEETISVFIEVSYLSNSSLVYSDTETSSTFIWTWNSANNETDYLVEVTISHVTFGVMTTNQVVAGLLSGRGLFDITILGTLDFNTAYLIPAFIILCAAAAFSAVNPYLGLFAAIATAMLFGVIGWLPVQADVLVFCIALVIVGAIGHARRRIISG